MLIYIHHYYQICVCASSTWPQKTYLLTGQEKLAAVPASLKVWIGGLTEETTWILSFNFGSLSCWWSGCWCRVSEGLWSYTCTYTVYVQYIFIYFIYPPVNQQWNGKSPSLIGDRSSKGPFSIATVESMLQYVSLPECSIIFSPCWVRMFLKAFKKKQVRTACFASSKHAYKWIGK